MLANSLYEHAKGIRPLFMITIPATEVASIGRHLKTEGIAYHVHRVGRTKANVFFGRAICVETVRQVVTKPLYQLSPEEDFILGSLLGYDKEQQCRRLLDKMRLTERRETRLAV